MRASLGAPADFQLDHLVGEEPQRRFQEMLVDLRHRSDSVGNATTFTAAYAAADRDEIFRVTDLRPPADGGQNGDTRRITRFLDGRGCKIDAIRRELVEGAGPEAAAMVIEMGEIEPTAERAGYDIASLSLVGPGYVVPVGFERTDYPSTETARVHLIEHRVAHDLLDQAVGDLAVHGIDPPPLIGVDQRHAENPLLRRHIREMGIEYLLPVGEHFDETAEPRHINARARERLLLSEKMPFAADGKPPQPQLYSPAVPPEEREYLFGLPGEEPEYAIVHPRVSPGSGGLTAHKGLRRAAQLVDLARSFKSPRVIEELRLPNFLHLNSTGWQTAAYLLAAHWAAGLGRLPPPKR
jgi:hypothetical protein